MQMIDASSSLDSFVSERPGSLPLLADGLTTAHEDIRRQLDWLTTPQDCGSREFDFASDVEAMLADLEWELHVTLSHAMSWGDRDRLEFALREASLEMDSAASVAEYDFDAVPLSERMHQLSLAYDEAADCIATTALNSRAWTQMREALESASTGIS